jgi:drug/metabolite transporter (DMT)-like permease
MPTETRRRAAPALAMLVAIIFWGGSFTATKAAMTEVPPVLFALMRFVLASLTMLAAHVATRTPIVIPREQWPRIVWVGLLGTTATYVLENIALKYTTSGNGSLLIAISPLLTAIGAVLFLGEQVSAYMVAGAACAAVGVLMLVGADLSHTGLGDAIMLITACIGVAYNLLSKRLADALPPLTALTATFGVGLLGLLPCACAEWLWFPGPWHPGVATFAGLAYLGFGSSCLACWLWMYALGHMPASRAVLFLFLMPLVTLLGGHQFLGERLGVDTALEAGLILLGVYVASTARPQNPKKKPIQPLPTSGEAQGTARL